MEFDKDIIRRAEEAESYKRAGIDDIDKYSEVNQLGRLEAKIDALDKKIDGLVDYIHTTLIPKLIDLLNK